MGLFERYLTVWVFLSIGAGITLGRLFPTAFETLGGLKVAEVNLPVAALIWLMIVPMLLKIDSHMIGEACGDRATCSGPASGWWRVAPAQAAAQTALITVLGVMSFSSHKCARPAA